MITVGALGVERLLGRLCAGYEARCIVDGRRAIERLTFSHLQERDDRSGRREDPQRDGRAGARDGIAELRLHGR